MPNRYVLDDENNPVETDNLEKWTQFFESDQRIVAEDNVRSTRISTVFLGIDHNFLGRGRLLLFETMIFGGKFDGFQCRYATYDEAKQGHIKLVRKVLLEDRK